MDAPHRLPATCLGCGCTCDDIEIAVVSGRIVEARNACDLGAAWFGDGVVPDRARADGHEGTHDAALGAAARLLIGARRALVYLAPDISCETQREAVALAEVLRASIDGETSVSAMASVLAAQERGRATATLGEVRHRADVIVFWGVDPADRYPRYSTRYAPGPPGIHLREGRTVIAVDVGEARGPADADRRLRVSASREVSTLTWLAARVASRDGGAPSPFTPAEMAEVTGTAVTATATTVTATDDTQDGESMGGHPSGSAAGPERGATAELAGWLIGGRYVVIVAEAAAVPGLDPGRAGALTDLVQALNGSTRAALSLLRAGGNATGADAVLTWQTGYPAAVDFSRGVPRYRPHDGTATVRLARGDVDALLVVGAADRMPADLLDRMRQVPHAVVGPRASDSRLGAGHAAIDTAVAGIHEAGLALRMDEVPLPLRRVIDGPPAAAAMVRALRERCRQP